MTRSKHLPRLRELREAADYSKVELSEQASVHWRTIHRAEQGEPVTFTSVAKIAAGLGVRPEDLS